MTGQNLLIGLSYIDRKYIEESEQDFSEKKANLCLTKPMGIAYNAVILPPDFIGRKDTKRRRWLCALPSPSLN